VRRAALAVLVHHQSTSAALAAPSSSAAPAMRHGMAHTPACMAMAAGSCITPHQHGLPNANAPRTDSSASSPAEGHEGGAACASASMQHCATASVEAAKFAVPLGKAGMMALVAYRA
jgi:hypothetical protein